MLSTQQGQPDVNLHPLTTFDTTSEPDTNRDMNPSRSSLSVGGAAPRKWRRFYIMFFVRRQPSLSLGSRPVPPRYFAVMRPSFGGVHSFHAVHTKLSPTAPVLCHSSTAHSDYRLQFSSVRQLSQQLQSISRPPPSPRPLAGAGQPDPSLKASSFNL